MRGTRILSALVIVALAAPIASVSVQGYDVSPNAPNCDSKKRVAERLTREETNRKYFERLTVRGANPTIFRYAGPFVDLKVQRDYVVSRDYWFRFGSVLTQRREARLSDFYVRCYDRLDVPYTYWPGKGCLDGVLGQDWRSVNQWLIYNLGGRSRSWSQLNFHTFNYDGPKVLFTVPLDALVWLRDENGVVNVLTPGYMVYGSILQLQCYAGQELAGTLNYKP
jgi:hypothetical protein